MTTPLQTPGVYIQELNAFSDGIVPVPTAVTAFIGYTEKITGGVNTVHVSSLTEYEQLFGKGPVGFMQFTIRIADVSVVSKPLQPVIIIAEKNYVVRELLQLFIYTTASVCSLPMAEQIVILFQLVIIAKRPVSLISLLDLTFLQNNPNQLSW